jgi:UDP-3-O-[3-hydroxymyristoyl] glucosamine N-acyltransferase
MAQSKVTNTKEIYGLNSLENADLNQISYAVSEKFKEAMINLKAGAIIVNEELKEFCKTNAIIVKDVYLAYSILSHKFKQSQSVNNLSFGNEVDYPILKLPQAL